MAAQAKPFSQLLQRLVLQFSETAALDWMANVFPAFEVNVRPLALTDRLYEQAGMGEGKSLGAVRLDGECGTVEVPVFLVNCARLGSGPQRKQQFLCAQRMLRNYGFASKADTVVGALFSFTHGVRSAHVFRWSLSVSSRLPKQGRIRFTIVGNPSCSRRTFRVIKPSPNSLMVRRFEPSVRPEV